jgi:hypothetical protein
MVLHHTAYEVERLTKAPLPELSWRSACRWRTGLELRAEGKMGDAGFCDIFLSDEDRQKLEKKVQDA